MVLDIEVNPDPTVSLYEQTGVQALFEERLRPGGEALTRRAIEAAAIEPGTRVVDLGCGLGHTAALMQADYSLRPVGIDYSAKQLDQAASRYPEFAFIRAEAGDIPLARSSVATVMCECVLSLCPDRHKTLREVWRILLPGGKLLLTDLYTREEAQAPVVPSVKTCVNGAVALQILFNSFQLAGFTLLVVEDHTRMLQQLAGQIIFTYGSLQQFFRGHLACGAEGCTRSSLTRLGYFMIIAEKRSG